MSDEGKPAQPLLVHDVKFGRRKLHWGLLAAVIALILTLVGTVVMQSMAVSSLTSDNEVLRRSCPAEKAADYRGLFGYMTNSNSLPEDKTSPVSIVETTPSTPAALKPRQAEDSSLWKKEEQDSLNSMLSWFNMIQSAFMQPKNCSQHVYHGRGAQNLNAESRDTFSHLGKHSPKKHIEIEFGFGVIGGNGGKTSGKKQPENAGWHNIFEDDDLQIVRHDEKHRPVRDSLGNLPKKIDSNEDALLKSLIGADFFDDFFDGSGKKMGGIPAELKTEKSSPKSYSTVESTEIVPTGSTVTLDELPEFQDAQSKPKNSNKKQEKYEDDDTEDPDDENDIDDDDDLDDDMGYPKKVKRKAASLRTSTEKSKLSTSESLTEDTPATEAEGSTESNAASRTESSTDLPERSTMGNIDSSNSAQEDTATIVNLESTTIKDKQKSGEPEIEIVPPPAIFIDLFTPFTDIEKRASFEDAEPKDPHPASPISGRKTTLEQMMQEVEAAIQQDSVEREAELLAQELENSRVKTASPAKSPILGREAHHQPPYLNDKNKPAGGEHVASVKYNGDASKLQKPRTAALPNAVSKSPVHLSITVFAGDELGLDFELLPGASSSIWYGIRLRRFDKLNRNKYFDQVFNLPVGKHATNVRSFTFRQLHKECRIDITAVTHINGKLQEASNTLSVRTSISVTALIIFYLAIFWISFFVALLVGIGCLNLCGCCFEEKSHHFQSIDTESIRPIVECEANPRQMERVLRVAPPSNECCDVGNSTIFYNDNVTGTNFSSSVQQEKRVTFNVE